MTLKEAIKLRAGDTVTWTDPDQGLCSRTAVIASIDVRVDEGEDLPEDGDNDIEIRITWEDGAELGCYSWELSKGGK